MSRALDKRLKLLEYRRGRITISEQTPTPNEEDVVKAITQNYFAFVERIQPSAAEKEEFEDHVRIALRRGGETAE